MLGTQQDFVTLERWSCIWYLNKGHLWTKDQAILIPRTRTEAEALQGTFNIKRLTTMALLRVIQTYLKNVKPFESLFLCIYTYKRCSALKWLKKGISFNSFWFKRLGIWKNLITYIYICPQNNVLMHFVSKLFLDNVGIVF